MSSVLTDPLFRPKVARALQHGPMKSVCQEYARSQKDLTDRASGEMGDGSPALEAALNLCLVAEAFIALQAARESADYDAAYELQHREAVTLVSQAEDAFAAWLTAQGSNLTITFLQDLFCKNIIKRKGQ